MRIAPSSGVQLILDTNTALSGLLWDGPPARLIEAAETGKLDLITSVALLTELRNVLSREKFSRPLVRRKLDRHAVFAYYLAMVSIAAPADIAPTVIADLTDDAVLATAIGGRVDLIVSGVETGLSAGGVDGGTKFNSGDSDCGSRLCDRARTH
jgi:putative PIN family toxin of toxin-antitoxin system